MGLYNTAYLEIDDGLGSEAVFELREVETPSGELTRSFIMGDRGQYISEINSLVKQSAGFNVAPASLDRRTGRWLDGGAGNWAETIIFRTGLEDIQWGDGSGGQGRENITQTDASGGDVRPLTRLQILKYWLAQVRSDSYGYTRLHWGEWTDGSFDEYRDGEYVNVEAGVYERPMVVAIEQFSHSKDEVSSFEGTLTMNRAKPMPNAIDGVAQFIRENAIGEDPDYLDGGA